ncbi:MAG: sigma 54-interacting transcriptional regulator [Oscillospiraceae bacterium]|nr:sigma 54-interacting transcriptional regulator [Oscillospiraceae bacterium]
MMMKNTQENDHKNLIEENNALYQRGQMQVLEMGDNVADGVLVVDGSGTILGANALICTWMNVPEAKLIGQSISLMQKQITQANRVMLKDARTVTDVFWEEHTNKKVLMTCSPFFSAHGQFLCGVTVLRDLTDIMELSAQLNLLKNDTEMTHSELDELRSRYVNNSLVGDSKIMLRLKHTIERVAKTDATILIQGETGSGKEVVARELHKCSLRADKPFVTINCAAIPESLLESELFGYVKGSFTGAGNKDKKGIFEVANGGTLLLDEIGDMPYKLQAKLLRVLQEKEIMRIGDTKPVSIDVRFLAATNRDLPAMVNEKEFRQDLYFRLNVVNITIAPLREHKDDIGMLANSILKKYNAKYDKQCRLDMQALFALEQHDWPGNVRELENVIERLVLFGDDSIGLDEVYSIITVTKKHFPYEVFAKASHSVNDSLPLKEQIQEFERERITAALEKHGSTRKAGDALGMSQSSIMRRIKTLGITGWREEQES